MTTAPGPALWLSVVGWAVLATVGIGRAGAEEVDFKCPGPGMHFTAGLPVIAYPDLNPRDDNHAGWPQAECYWDGQLITRINLSTTNYDYYPFVIPPAKVTVGNHSLKVIAYWYNGVVQQYTLPGGVQVDAWPAAKTQITLNSDLTVTDLNWTNVAVKGNGHTVTVSGSMTVKDSLITGLGSLSNISDPATNIMVNGVTGTLTGAVTIQNSIFESTGALKLTLNGSGAVAIKNNEFRASNYIKFVSSNPDASPLLDINGSNATLKLFQGNRIASGRVVFTSMNNWLIGSDTTQNEADGNILNGPRCTINAVGCNNVTIRGNYSRHAYISNWSQGYNFVYSTSGSNILTEHNLIRGSSWPVQDLTGEFRYNLVIEYGHEWVRTVLDGTIIHHNVFVPNGPGGLSYGIWCYLNWQYPQARNIRIYNNTFDGGGNVTGDFAGPFVGTSTATVEISSLRNNLFTYARNTQNGSAGQPLVSVEAGAIDYADYNAFYSPNSSQTANYSLTIPGKSQGSPGFAGHDVSGSGAGQIGVVNGRLAAHPFVGQRYYPYTVDEGAVWNRTLKLSTVLADFRTRYTPAAGSPIIDKGDPADGPGVDIGAIEAAGGVQRPEDKFGRFGPTAAPPPPPSPKPNPTPTPPPSPTGRFTNVTTASGVQTIQDGFLSGDWVSGLSLVDLDGDNKLDLYVGMHDTASRPHAVAALNNGSGVFTKSVSNNYPRSEMHLPYDLNEDGKLDVAVTYNDGGSIWYTSQSTPGNLAFTQTNVLRDTNSARINVLLDLSKDGKVDWLRGAAPGVAIDTGNGSGNFTAGFKTIDTASSGPEDTAIFPIQLDNAGTYSLALAWGSYAIPNGVTRVYRNDGAMNFTDVTTAIGLPTIGCIKGVGDYNQDGYSDILFLDNNHASWSIYLNDGAGHFTKKVNAISGISGTPLLASGGMGILTDVDNDGIGDLIVGWYEGLAVLRGTGAGNFTAMNTTWALTSQSKGDDGWCFGDIDGDGMLDLIAYNGNLDQTPTHFDVYHNDLTKKNWINVRVVGLAGNKGAAGAKIRINAPGGPLLWYEPVQIFGKQMVGSYYSFLQTERHFGLGSRTKVDVTVQFYPSGKTVMKLGVNVNSTIVIQETP